MSWLFCMLLSSLLAAYYSLWSVCGEGFLQDVHYTLRESFFLCVLELLELGARFALHMPGKNYIMEKWTKKSESTNT